MTVDKLRRPSRRGVDRNQRAHPAAGEAAEGVAPHAGAWIETCPARYREAPCPSPLTQGRGSKPDQVIRLADHGMSPLTQGRGSKLFWPAPRIPSKRSPLTQGRGSKRPDVANGRVRSAVAPHAGAWIETITPHRTAEPPARRPSRRGVDRNWYRVRRRKRVSVAPHAGAWIETARPASLISQMGSPLTQGRGSKRPQGRALAVDGPVAPHAGAWIETRPI